MTDILGVVVDLRTKEAIPGAIISLDPAGTKLITNEIGQFNVAIQKSSADSLVVSSVGYFSTKVSLEEVLRTGRIELRQMHTILNELIIQESFTGKSINLGQQKIGLFKTAAFIDGNYGEAAKQMDPKGKTIFLNKVAFYIENKSKAPFKFLLDVYASDPEGNPGGSLLPKKITIQDSKESGWVEVNMNDYNIITNQLFFVGLQWTIDDTDPFGLATKFWRSR